jgi:hypothetical protein
MNTVKWQYINKASNNNPTIDLEIARHDHSINATPIIFLPNAPKNPLPNISPIRLPKSYIPLPFFFWG